MINWSMLAAAGGLALSASVAAHADPVVYTSSAAFFSALGAPAVTETYEGFAANTVIAPGSTINGITYTSFPAGTAGRIDTRYNRIGSKSLALERGSSPVNFFVAGEGMSITFPYAVNAAAVFFNVVASPAGSLQLVTPAGTAGNGTAYDQSTLYFVGLISKTPFHTASLRSTLAARSGYNVDNLTYAAAPVPEPATLTLLAFGCVGLIAFARRRE